jgi:hypothetical protein
VGEKSMFFFTLSSLCSLSSSEEDIVGVLGFREAGRTPQKLMNRSAKYLNLLGPQFSLEKGEVLKLGDQ